MWSSTDGDGVRRDPTSGTPDSSAVWWRTGRSWCAGCPSAGTVPGGVLGDEELGVWWSAAVGFAFGTGEGQVRVGVAGDGPSASVDQRVMAPAQQRAVGAVGRSTLVPVPDVVDVGESLLLRSHPRSGLDPRDSDFPSQPRTAEPFPRQIIERLAMQLGA